MACLLWFDSVMKFIQSSAKAFDRGRSAGIIGNFFSQQAFEFIGERWHRTSGATGSGPRAFNCHAPVFVREFVGE